MAAVTVAGLGTTLGSTAHADPAIQCTPVKVVAVPGTWETEANADPNAANGMLKAITDRLQQQFGGKVSSYYVPYQATAFNEGVTYADSERSGVNATNDAIKQIAGACPGTKFVGIGYSQGADVNGDVAAAIGAGRGPIPASDFIAGGNLADPQTTTPGEVNLGAKQPRTKGILGPRTGGYRALNGKVAVACLRGDLYCATPNRDHLIRALGAVGGHIGVSGLEDSAERELASGSEKKSTAEPKDLSGLPAGVRRLAQQAQSGDTKGVARTADQLADMLVRVQRLTSTVATPALTGALANSPDPRAQAAGRVLRALSRTDMTGLATDLRRAGVAAEKHNLDALVRIAADAVRKAGPMTGLPAADLAKASTVITALQPTALLSQAGNIASIAKLDYTGMLKAVRALPRNVRKGDPKAVYRTLTAVENRLMPLAKIANRVDFKALGAALALSQDPNVRAVGHALVILDRVNWVRITRDLRIIQSRLAKFDPRHPPKINRKHPEKSLNKIFGVNLLGLVGPLTDLGQHGLDVAGIKLPNGSLRQLVRSSLNPREVIRQGLEVGVFFGTKVHMNYGSTPVDGTGRPATTTLADWLAGRVAAA